MTDRWIRRILPPGRVGATIGMTGSCPPRTADCLSDAPVPYSGYGGITPLAGENTWPCMDNPGERVPYGGGGYQGPQGAVGSCGVQVMDATNTEPIDVTDVPVVLPLRAVTRSGNADASIYAYNAETDEVTVGESGYYDIEYKVMFGWQSESVAVEQLRTWLNKNDSPLDRTYAGGFLVLNSIESGPYVTNNARVVEFLGAGTRLSVSAVAATGATAVIPAYGANLVVILQRCLLGETGPDGPAGPPGAPGAQGYQGYQGYQGGPCPQVSAAPSFLTDASLTGSILAFTTKTLTWESGCLKSAGAPVSASFDLCDVCEPPPASCDNAPDTLFWTAEPDCDGALGGYPFPLYWDDALDCWWGAMTVDCDPINHVPFGYSLTVTCEDGSWAWSILDGNGNSYSGAFAATGSGDDFGGSFSYEAAEGSCCEGETVTITITGLSPW